MSAVSGNAIKYNSAYAIREKVFGKAISFLINFIY